MIWFTADTHFFHKNVIDYCNRPFASVEMMHAQLIYNWNETVARDDEIYILGDFVFGGTEKIKSIASKLNGIKHLIRGNHDDKKLLKRAFEFGFETVFEPRQGTAFSIGNFLLSHYPYAGTGDSSEEERYTERRYIDEGRPLLHGHVHCAWKRKGNMLNVGCDVWNYRPVSLETIKEEFK